MQLRVGPVRWDFMVTGGRRSGAWSTIPVPSNWELHGFGTYKYGGPPPRPTEEGRYGRSFEVPSAWRGKRDVRRPPRTSRCYPPPGTGTSVALKTTRSPTTSTSMMVGVAPGQWQAARLQPM